ncbi:MAG: NAD-dependent epimerase/dehydratase family protein [Gemmatimonadota bacterium]
MELRGKRVLVTGGEGFLGSHLTRMLDDEGAQTTVVRSREHNLTEQNDTRRLLADTSPQIVIHLAADVGGIGANRVNPGRYFYGNMAMGLNVIEESRRHGVEKIVQIGTVCAYPKHTPVPFREDDLWNGYPEETNAPYGVAKKALLVMLQGYRQQYGVNGIYLLPANLYGPGDDFDLETSHVIPALIRQPGPRAFRFRSHDAARGGPPPHDRLVGRPDGLADAHYDRHTDPQLRAVHRGNTPFDMDRRCDSRRDIGTHRGRW